MSPAGQEPLFASTQSPSIRSNEAEANEEDALLGDRRKHLSSHSPGFWRRSGIVIWAVVATIVVVVLAIIVHKQSPSPKHGKKAGKQNLVFMVSDGMGPATLSMTRSFRQLQLTLPIADTLILDKHLIGSSRTRSDNSLITDSAAGATAFSCGLKSYNGAISVLPDHSPCGTVLEAAKAAGYITGLVTTTRITDATPACFASHVRFRGEEDLIAQQEIGEHPLGRVVDLLIGGGRCHFLPNTTRGSCRSDERDLISIAKETYGWNYISQKQDFDNLKAARVAKLPLLALLADGDVPFEIDRKEEEYPSLNEMTQLALKALEAAVQDNAKGFFLVVEGARIDHAGHGNDPAAQVHEVLAYDQAFATVHDFFKKSSRPGALIATSDHDTGGLSVARQLHSTYPEYLWHPEVLVNASHSSEFLAKVLYDYVKSQQQEEKESLKGYINKELVQLGLGIYDATDEELENIVNNDRSTSYILADMISRRAQIGWSTHGHSAVDVNIYGSEGTEILRGNHENTDVGQFLKNYLAVDVEAVTEKLHQKAKNDVQNARMASTWLGRTPTKEDLQELPTYHAKHIDPNEV